MKKICFCMILVVMLFMYIAIPASAATASDIYQDPNYEVYTEVVTFTIDIDCVDDYISYDFTTYYDPFVLYHELRTVSYPGMIGTGVASWYDFGGEDYYYTGDDAPVSLPRDVNGVYVDFYADVPLEDVVVTITTYKFRLSALAGGSAEAYDSGYADGYAQGRTDFIGEKEAAVLHAESATRLAIIEKMQAWLAEFGCDVSHIVPFEHFNDIGAVYLDAFSDYYDSEVLPDLIDGWIDYGYDWGFRDGQVDHIDEEFIVDQLDVLASNFSNTIFQVLNEQILGYSLMEFILALVIIMVVLVALPFIRGFL